MYRPLIWFSAAFAVGCGLALIHISIPLVAAAIILAVGVGLTKIFHKLFPVFVLCAGLICGICYTWTYHQYIVEPITTLSGQSQYITVTATEFATKYEENQRLEVRVDGNDVGCAKNFKTLLYLPLTEKEIAPGDKITGKVGFYTPRSQEDFDKQTYYRSQGYFVLASIDKNLDVDVIPPQSRPFSYYPKQFAKNLRDVFTQLGTERQSAFWDALITGDRSDLTVIDTNHMRKSGLSHVIAVSGLHVGFLISFLLLVFGRKVGTALGIPILIAFYCMIGWSPSIVRACIMYGIMLLSFWVKRESDSVNSMFAALLIILIVLPDALLSVSLQLSFASTYGILCFASRIQTSFALSKKAPKSLKNLYQIFIGGIACTIGSMLFTMPILLYHFGYISVFSILSNCLALWAISLLFPLLAVGGIIGLFSLSIADMILIPARYLTDYIYGVIDWTAGLPYGILSSESNTDFYLSIAFCVLAALLLWKGKRWMVATGVPVMIAILIGCSVLRGINAENDLSVSIFDESRGQAILVSCGDQTTLIDCSTSGYHDVVQDIVTYLDWNHIDCIDTVILTSVDLTHARNVCELLNIVPVKNVILPKENKENKEPYPELMATLASNDISYEAIAPQAETPIGDDSLGISVLGTIPRKLAVHIQSENMDVWTVHALTQNMLLQLTEQQNLCCDTLIVSNGFSQDQEEMQELLHRIKPSQIVLLNGWKSGKNWCHIPIINPYYSGQIDWKTIRD